MTIRCIALLFLLLSVQSAAHAAEPTLPNGGFEQGTTGWNPLWTREADAGTAELISAGPHAGARCMRVTHRGARDWSLDRAERIAVSPGDVFEMRAWVRIQGTGTATMCLTLRDREGQVIDWTYAGRTLAAPADWRELGARFAIPRGAASIQPRFVGSGAAVVSLDDVSLTPEGKVEMMAVEDMARVPAVENAVLKLALGAQEATFDVTDKRTGRVWRQVPLPAAPMVSGARAAAGGLDLDLLIPAANVAFSASVRLDGNLPEVSVELRGDGPMAAPLQWPQPFATRAGDLLIMPVNEGISYPADDASLPQMRYILYGGHGLCMAWYGVTSRAADGVGCEDGIMAIVETPDDASVAVPRHDTLLVEAPQWDPQKGAFGYLRRIRYVFLADGGYVAMAKRYRAYAQQIGLLRTLAEKREKVPAIDLLVGAVNIWCWQQDAPGICRRMQSVGIDRILWSHRSPPEQLAELNAMGVLTSRYDIYQDVMDPANFVKLRGVHPDWLTEAWPDDCIVGADAKLINGWMVRGKDGEPYHCNVLCDLRAPDYARRRIGAELKDHPYRCRFIDTTTASPWRECHDADHPMTRTQSRQAKMELLRVVSEEFGLVCGSETGHDAAMPYADYFEGMMSLGPYRVPDAGRNIQQIVEEAPERVATFQTGPYYRLPLWELVYHDCVVAQWYWGDYNNKLPALWDRRDLFNALYATPPMFMFNTEVWAANEERFVQSYRQSAAVVRACGYSEMTDHRWLTTDHTVQQTRFANGVTVTVNFGDKPYDTPGGPLAPMSKRVEGL